jgi:hypothetical protein
MAGGAFVAIAIASGLSAGMVGKIKGSSFFIWFMVGLFAPIIGIIAALAYRWDRDEVRRECPTCGKIVKLHDAICTRCGTELEFPEEGIVPESVEKELRRAS